MTKEAMKARIIELIANCNSQITRNVDLFDVSERCETVLNQQIGLQITVWSRGNEKTIQLDCYAIQNDFFHGFELCNADDSFIGIASAQFATMRDALEMQFAIISELIDESAA